MRKPSTNIDPIDSLISRLQQGDEAALPVLIEHSASRLQQLAHHMLRGFPGLKRWVETDDVLQNALVRLMRAVGQIPIESPRHFFALSALQLRRELHDLARHFFGSEGIGANHSSQDLAGGSDALNLHVDDNSQEPICLEPWTELHKQIEHLPANEREVMDLIYYDGLSQTQAAQLLEVSVRTIQRRWQNALLLLREKLVGDWPYFE